MNTRDQKYVGIGIGGFLAALALGAGLGILLAPRSGEETQEYLAKKTRGWTKKLKEGGLRAQSVLEDVFGEANAELRQSYEDIKAEISARAEELSEKQELTRRKYRDIAREAVERYARGKNWAEESIRKLAAEFEKGWKDFS